MLLSSREIRKYAENSECRMIQPFSEDHLQSASYDVSISGRLTKLKNPGQPIDPAADGDLSEMYDHVVIDRFDGCLFCPGEYVLVELRERLHIPKNLAAHIRPRTRFTRSGILVADQHCNPTYDGILQIGLYHAGKVPFILREGLKIAQLVFEELTSVPEEEKLYQNKKNAGYSHETEFRGSRFGEENWSEEGKKLYQDVMASLKRG